jgi:hypothetical protein
VSRPPGAPAATPVAVPGPRLRRCDPRATARNRSGPRPVARRIQAAAAAGNEAWSNIPSAQSPLTPRGQNDRDRTASAFERLEQNRPWHAPVPVTRGCSPAASVGTRSVGVRSPRLPASERPSPKSASWRNVAIHAASRINRLRTSSSAASQCRVPRRFGSSGRLLDHWASGRLRRPRRKDANPGSLALAARASRLGVATYARPIGRRNASS